MGYFSEEKLLQIDEKFGMSRCLNDEAFYGQMKESFVEEGEENLQKLELFLGEENWNETEIIVHSVKNTSINIGALEFSEASKQFEFAVKEGCIEFVKNNLREYMQIYGKLLEILRQ